MHRCSPMPSEGIGGDSHCGCCVEIEPAARKVVTAKLVCLFVRVLDPYPLLLCYSFMKSSSALSTDFPLFVRDFLNGCPNTGDGVADEALESGRSRSFFCAGPTTWKLSSVAPAGTSITTVVPLRRRPSSRSLLMPVVLKKTIRHREQLQPDTPNQH